MLPLWYLLVPYALIVAVVGLFVFFNVYHISKFGLQSVLSRFVIAIYTLSFLAVVIISVIVLSTYRWDRTIDASNLIRFDLSGTALDNL
jgi:hypothetical protein